MERVKMYKNSPKYGFKKGEEFIVKRNENNENAHKMLAKVYEKLEKYELALEEYQKTYDINSQSYESLLKIGEINNKIGKKNEAIDVLSKLLKVKPEFYELNVKAIETV